MNDEVGGGMVNQNGREAAGQERVDGETKTGGGGASAEDNLT